MKPPPPQAPQPAVSEDANIVAAGLKALEALKIVASSEPPVSLSELARKLHVSQATAYRFAMTLVKSGFVASVAGRGGYRPTMAIVELASDLLDGTPVRGLAVPVLTRVAEQFGESVTLAVPDGDHIVFVDQIAVNRNVDFYCRTGKRLPLHVGAAARCVLAHYPDRLFAEYTDRSLAAFTNSTKTTAGVLRADRAEIRERGFAVSVEDVEVGISGVGVPLLNRAGDVLGAATIANITARWDARAIKNRAEAMVEASLEIAELCASLPAETQAL